MPVIPEASDFPSASKKGSTETQNKPSEQREKATAADHLSKGPQIPDEMPPKASREETEARMKELNK
ncbi:Uncharacterized protein PECH_002698 [Penicillium ucsense]|uniref:Uncharacterized protein n=1 Tax=Penicillium ucsense TaxID=2839758 RepID=A0A8J8W9K6_9EURO|nr:Uncharacterized protein PECM_003585 [Penicillium ucsense]KAF7737865.1 Uncharacterized protein PECH_002698 [Penicillium ucsense]